MVLKLRRKLNEHKVRIPAMKGISWTTVYVFLYLCGTYVDGYNYLFASPIYSEDVEVTLNIIVDNKIINTSVSFELKCNDSIATEDDLDAYVTQFHLNNFTACNSVLHGSRGAAVKLARPAMVLMKTAHLDNVNMMRIYMNRHLGHTYYVNTFCPWDVSRCFLTVVANRKCNITLKFPPHVSNNDLVSVKPSLTEANTIYLEQYHVLGIESKADLTGTYLSATADIVVYSGARNVPGKHGKRHHYTEQLLPVEYWQKEYIILPGSNEETNTEGDIIRIINKEPDTLVQITGYKQFKMPFAGNYIQRRIDGGSFSRVAADKPIQVLQYSALNIYNSADTNSNSNHIPMMRTAFAPEYDYWYTFRHQLATHLCLGSYSLSVIAEDMSGWHFIPGSTLTATHASGNVSAVPDVLRTSIAGFLKCETAGDEWSVLYDYSLPTSPTGCVVSSMSPNDMLDNDCDGSINEEECTEEDLVTKLNVAQTNPLRSLTLTGLESVKFRIVQCCDFVSFIFRILINPYWWSGASDYILINIFPDMIRVYNKSNLLNITSQDADDCNATTREYIFSWGELGVALVMQDPPLKLTFRNVSIPEIHLLEIIPHSGDVDVEIDLSFHDDLTVKDCGKIQSGVPIESGKNFIVYLDNPAGTGQQVQHDDSDTSDITVTELISSSALQNVQSWMSSGNIPSVFRIQSATNISISYFDSLTSAKLRYAALPQRILGTQYVAIAYDEEKTDVSTKCTITALSAPVTLKIIPSSIAGHIGSFNIHLLGAHSTETFRGHLHSYQTVMVTTQEDITGTYFESNRPVAVFCGVENEGVFEQLPPLDAFDSTYYIDTRNFLFRHVDTNDNYQDVFVVALKIVALYDSTVVIVSADFDQLITLQFRGDFEIFTDFTDHTVPFSVNSTKEVAVLAVIKYEGVKRGKIVPPSFEDHEVCVIGQEEDNDCDGLVNEECCISDLPSNSDSIEIPCYTDSTTWQGTVSITRGNLTCQRWDSQAPHKHDRNDINTFPDDALANASNFCRDPDREGAPWCYTTDPQIRFDFCNVIQCPFPDADLDGAWFEDCYPDNSSEDVIPSMFAEPHNWDIHKRSVRAAFLGDMPEPPTAEPTDGNDITLSSHNEPSGGNSANRHTLGRRSTYNQTKTTNETWICSNRTCRCPCGWDIPQNLTKDQINEKAEEYVKKLTIDKTTLASAIRSRISAENKETSSKVIGGVLGITFCTILLLTVLILDLPSLIEAFQYFRQGLWDCWHA